MLRVLLLERSEEEAQETLQVLKQMSIPVSIEDVCYSMKETWEWWQTHPTPDVVISEVHVQDGPTLPFLQSLGIPVILIADSEVHALEAFKLPCIDYLVKSISPEQLSYSFQKFLWMQQGKPDRSYKTRFMVRLGDTISVRRVDEVAYFFADEKVVYLVTHDKRKYIIDFTLEQLISQLNPKKFFRVNRRFILHIDSVIKMKPSLARRIQLFTQPAFEQEIFIPKEKVSAFKQWLDA
ncbi:MAG: LytR/AlgR family response regulator transcription factor [Spirosomataceae bacterium]